MRTFGWTPSDEELKDMVNVIDQVWYQLQSCVIIMAGYKKALQFTLLILILWGWYQIACLFRPRNDVFVFRLFMIVNVTQDGDGDISFNEFVWLMTR